ncbi:MAG: MarR family transcriptional regulator [Coriobacteriia bacterium]|nr:MarR family transcriptional regulator [Coriobacteriia bacterium]
MARTPSGPTLWLSLFRTTEAMHRVAARSMANAGLGFSDFTLLEVLLHIGPLTPSALAEKLGLTSGSITAALDRLESRGLIGRGVNPADQRSRIIELTDAGRALIGPAYTAHAADIEALVRRALTAEQRRELFGLLGAVRKTARENTP